MKRFHIHLAVNDLTTSITFYSKLFGQLPSKQEPDYAKWMLEDPRVNFAISSRGHPTGLNHFGMQAETPEELASLKVLADDAAGGAAMDQGEVACCYAKSEKHWTIDPQGMAWEHFLTMPDAFAFGEGGTTQSGACCIPLRTSAEFSECETGCIPQATAKVQGHCCG